jgi:hypothetical protein
MKRPTSASPVRFPGNFACRPSSGSKPKAHRLDRSDKCIYREILGGLWLQLVQRQLIERHVA